jgi:pimeloyl-ACP methyl ester carboxylesterase
MKRLPGVRGGTVLTYRLTPLGLPPLLLEPVLHELPLQTTKLVLLIHGFNVTEDEAFGTYRRFCSEQQQLADGDIGSSVSNDRAFIEVDWPGGIDAAKAVSWAGYPFAVSQAKELGPRIAADLGEAARRLGHLSLDVVAHSLGCRLAIETIRALSPSITVTGVVFQAAALDVEQLESPLDRFGLRSALLNAKCRIHSLYSEGDRVLSWAFPRGQELALEAVGWTKAPTALGHTRWDHASILGTSLRQVQIGGAGHSDYWGGGGKPKQVRNAQYEVRSALGFRPPGVRRLPRAEPLERKLAELRRSAHRTKKIS